MSERRGLFDERLLIAVLAMMVLAAVWRWFAHFLSRWVAIPGLLIWQTDRQHLRLQKK